MTIESTAQTDSKNTPTMAGNKRRRGAEGTDGGLGDEKTAQTSKCKGATTIPIFLKSTLNFLQAAKCLFIVGLLLFGE